MEPGMYPDISDHDYHADPALSSTGAKALIECPAIYREQIDNPVTKDAYDFGHVAHRLLLGKGSEIAVYPVDCLGANGAVSTAAAKEFAKTAREQGRVPIKPDDYAKAEPDGPKGPRTPRDRRSFRQWRGRDERVGCRPG